MSSATERTTVYLDAELHKALRLKSAYTHRPVSEIVNAAVRGLLREDEEDLAAFGERSSEPVISYEDLLAELKANGTL